MNSTQLGTLQKMHPILQPTSKFQQVKTSMYTVLISVFKTLNIHISTKGMIALLMNKIIKMPLELAKT